MRAVAISPEALRKLAADAGIDTVRDLAKRAEISEWVIYHALRRAVMQPSHVLAVARVLNVEPDALHATEQEASA